MNLFALLHDILNDDVLARMATYIDEPAEKTRKAVDGLIYTIVGGLMKRTTNEIGVNQLFSHIQKGRYDGALLDNLTTVLRDPGHTNALITQGNDVISHLLPAMKSSIGSMISGYAGIRNSSSISLLGLTTTVVLHTLGKMVKDRKLDADGLASALFAERETFVNSVPDEFMPRLVEKVGLQQIVSGVATPARRTVVETTGRSGTMARPVETVSRPAVSYEPADDSESTNGALTKWGIGILTALVVAAVGYYVYQNTLNYSGKITDGAVVTADTAQADTVARSLDVPVDAVTRTPVRSTSATVPASTVPVATTSSAGKLTQVMTPYLGNVTLPKGRVFPLSGVTFQPGSVSLTAGSEAVVNELATLLKTYPQLQVQLIGYANDAYPGITNKSLSFKRVNQIKQQLVTSGINFLRVDAIGRGTGVSRLDTVGPPRPTLRKIDVKVVTK